MVDYIIETRNLTKRFGKQTAVNSLDMKIEKGKIYGLLGKNGAGKTTTMCMLLNLSKPTNGEIFFFGKHYKQDPYDVYSKIGSIIETPGFYENLSAFDNLKVFAKLRGDYNKEDIEKALEIVSLTHAKDKKFKNFSLGMKQRLGIAAAIMHNPEILILDEPINGLDPMGIKEIRKLLKDLSEVYGTTILISSHILSEIEAIADVIGVMDGGLLIEEVSMNQLHEKLNKHVKFEVSDIDLACKILEKLTLKENIDFSVNENNIHLYNHLDLRAEFNEQFVKSGIKVNEMSICEESLEEYFTKIIDKKERYGEFNA
ncbi:MULTISPECIES: ABC transporter ATP-binding protein [Methanobrevibacter]|uniref:ABC transporter ATP-binding protein n=2 Tax=Methanobacteriaceae TaxID=2159 RepID=UPI0025F32665|nr:MULTISPECIES: ABC transporter ATP-binding protein [Methanobrevibacter]MBS7257258.1 ABC transporter ATP-binding protein [Methanobrevibacter sp.]MCI7428135.1 ABC transporter ATP-binding protein [Methanobrevibacter sp.]MDD6776723.1 ABC transporter ATP-binding protein [Methanobacteriaceae archaeon]MDY3097760.1 ABC transporter ATP-binding protein [Methanobrevibacter sp.]